MKTLFEQVMELKQNKVNSLEQSKRVISDKVLLHVRDTDQTYFKLDLKPYTHYMFDDTKLYIWLQEQGFKVTQITGTMVEIDLGDYILKDKGDKNG